MKNHIESKRNGKHLPDFMIQNGLVCLFKYQIHEDENRLIDIHWYEGISFSNRLHSYKQDTDRQCHELSSL